MNIERTEPVSFPLGRVENQRFGLGRRLRFENLSLTQVIRNVAGVGTTLAGVVIMYQQSELRNIEGVIVGGMLEAFNILVWSRNVNSKR